MTEQDANVLKGASEVPEDMVDATRRMYSLGSTNTQELGSFERCSSRRARRAVGVR